ncbi:hypothetical protein [Nocardia arthritidis]|uniref:hypothetical protein n=1 Tax=Nocardia arthritidis TaxID=228602 RepID=UPI0012ECDEAA|nr:hypothetical protein [Nocardia arthritidis]
MTELPQISLDTAKRAKMAARPSDHVAARPVGVAEFGGVVTDALVAAASYGRGATGGR